MRSFLCTMALAATLGAQAQIVITDADLQGGQTYNWVNTEEYLLDGFVFLEAGGVLNIQEGTVIRGKEVPSTTDNASALIITRDAQIFAEGTASEPIIFTAELDDISDPLDLLQSDIGLWGGLILLGNATIAFSATEGNIEGIPTSEPRGFYGGSNDDDNSGTLRYVSIRRGGAALSSGNEINGLTLGAVGRQTTIEHVEVSHNDDDGIEFFGGTADCKWCAVAFCADDAFDFDLGWRGRGQFWFVVQDINKADNGGEFDGADPDGATPFSQPTIYNATFIGSGSGAPAQNANAMLIRDAAGGTFANSIFTGFANFAIEVEDLPAASGVDSRQRVEDGDLMLLNNIWWSFGAGSELNAGDNGIIGVTEDAEDSTATWLINHLTANGNTLEDPQLLSIGRDQSGSLKPLPAAGGPAFSGLADEPADSWFEDVDFKGAFGTDLWVADWTALSQEGFLAGGALGSEIVPAASIGLELWPNPSIDRIAISLPEGQALLRIYDLQGKVLQEQQAQGPAFQWSVAGLENGTYVLVWDNGQQSAARLMAVAR